MGVYEFDQELYDQVLFENGKVIGREEGVKQAFLVFQKVQGGETDSKIIAESLGCTLKEVEMVREQFGIQSGDRTGNQEKDSRFFWKGTGNMKLNHFFTDKPDEL